MQFNLFYTHIILVYVLEAKQNHIPLKYMLPNKIFFQIRVINLGATS